jgi:hypothetical protein
MGTEPDDVEEAVAAAYLDAIDDAHLKLDQLAQLIDLLHVAQQQIGPWLARGWRIDPTLVWDATTGSALVPITADRTVRTLTCARERLAVLADALRACLHAQAESLHQLGADAHHAGICTLLDTCPHCTPDDAGHGTALDGEQ